jgi:hypothetical protein
VDIEDLLGGATVESLIRALDRSLRAQSAYVHRVDIVPIGASEATLRGATPDPGGAAHDAHREVQR